jgi:peptidoglycan/LPS O-acetylase OafA/YrhL
VKASAIIPNHNHAATPGNLLNRPAKRVLGLDIIRSIAILLVLWAHSTYVFPADTSAFLQSLLPVDLGVPIFFVLSGYLIGGILLRTIDETSFSIRDLKQFWIRRWFRTLPNYFLVLLLLCIYDRFVYKAWPAVSVRYFFFAQNLVTPNSSFFPEAWSLSIEEWFYLSFPLCCFLGLMWATDKKRVILFLACFFLIAPLLLRLYAYHNDIYTNTWTINYIVIYRLDALMYGVLGAYAHRYAPDLWRRVRTPGLVLGILLFVVLFAGRQLIAKLPGTPVYFYCLESLTTLAVLPYFSTVASLRSRVWNRIFTFISTTSYAMYILNLSLIQWRLVPAFMGVSGLRDSLGTLEAAITSFVLFWIAVVVGSYLLYRYFETPWMNLRDRITIHPLQDKRTLQEKAL